MNLRDIAKKVGSYINSKTQDDKGFFQQGKFEPLKAISNISTPTGTLGQNFQEIRSMGTQAFNPYQGIAENKNNNAFLRGGADIVNQGLKQFTNTSTLGLVQPQMGERQTKAGLIGAIGGGVAGFAANPFGKVMGSTDKLVSKIAPKAVGLAPKLIKGLGSEALQTLGYSSASLLGNKLGLNQRTGQFTKGNLTQDFLMGSVMRGGLGAVENLVGGTGNLKVKGFSMDNLTKDELVKAEDMLLNPSNYLEQRTFTTTRLKNKIEKEQIKKIQAEAFDTIGRLSAKYLPNSVFTKLEGNPKAQIKALIDLSSQNKLANVQMGIVDNSKLNKEISPIKTGGEDLISEAKKYKSAEEFVKSQQLKVSNPDNGLSYGELARKYKLSPNEIQKAENWGGLNNSEKEAIINKIDKLSLENYQQNNPNVGILSETYTTKNLTDVFNQSQISPSVKTGGDTIKIKPNEDIVKQFDETIKVGEQPKIKVSNLETPKQPELKQRGFSASVQEAPDIAKKTKIKVLGGYEPKSNDVLMGEAKALLTQGGTIKDVKNVQNIDQKITAAMQEAINLDAQGQHEAAANLFNNLSDIGTELGRGVQSYSLLQKMSPQAIALSAAGKIKKYNQTAKVKIPELTGQQQKVISDQVNNVINLPEGREKNIALNELENIINSFIPSSKTDKFLTVWKAGLLTSVRTHARNIVGNTIMQGSEMMSNVPGSFADRLMALRTGQRTLTPSVQGTLQGTKEGFSQAGDIMKYGFDPTETIQKFDIKKVNWGNTPTQKAMKAYTDFVFNSLSAEDKPFYQSSYVRSLYNQASAAAINAGKSGDAKYIKNLVDNATEQMKTIATNDANYATFKDKNALSKLASAFKQSTNGKWYTKLPAEIVAPFTQVPSSMVQKTFDYSPIGLIKGIKDAGKVITQNVPDLQRQAAQEIGRGTIGTGIFALGSYLMAKGLMTGQPKDDAERKQWELEGKQQNSILINGKWRSINSVGPQTLILLAGAKYDEEMNDPEGSMAQYGIGLVQDQLNQTFLSGVQQPLQAITDPQRYGKSYVGGQVASFVPNIVKDTAKAFDPVARETDTGSMMGNIKTSVQSGIPGWRNQMTPKRDTLGNILKQEPTGLGAYVDLFNSKTPISNTVVDELSRLNKAGFNATPSKLGTSQTISGIKVKLDQKSLDKYEETAGKAVSSALESLFASNSYQKLDDQSKQEAIDDVVSKERKKVRANMNLSWTPDMGYTKSTDSPTGISRVGLYGKSVITDPKQTIKAVLDGNPIRKVEGGTVILERKNSLGSLDQGNKATEVDHKIALTLGGTNKEDNLQVLTKEENRIKGAFETYLYKEMKAGRITKEEAQKRDLNWREEVGKIPQSEQTKIVEGLESEAVDTSSGKVYKLVSESGTVTTIDLSKAIEEPKLTGFTEVDKKLKSSYKSAITTRINNIVKLYEDGQLSAEEAEKYIKELKAKSTGTGSTKSKGGKITVKTPKYDIPKISVKFQETPSTIKLKSAPKIKVSSSNQRRYTIKA